MESAGKERRLGGPTGGWRRRREIRAEKRKNFDDFRRETPSLIPTRIPSKTPRIRPRKKIDMRQNSLLRRLRSSGVIPMWAVF